MTELETDLAEAIKGLLNAFCHCQVDGMKIMSTAQHIKEANEALMKFYAEKRKEIPTP